VNKPVSLDNLKGRRIITPTLPKVKICIPYYGGLPSVCVYITEEIIGRGIPGYSVDIVKKESTIIQFARNEMINEGLHHSQYDVLFFLDSDMGFEFEEMGKRDSLGLCRPVSLIKKILDNDLDICGGLYCQRKAPHRPLVFKWSPFNYTAAWEHWFDYPEGGVHEVDGIATGFLAIKSKVFRAFEEDNHKKEEILKAFKKEDISGLPPAVRDYLGIVKPTIYPPFWLDNTYNKLDDDYMKVGEDMYFCREAQRLGFKIHCDFSVQLGHETKKMITPQQYVHAYRAQLLAGREVWAAGAAERIKEIEKEAANVG